MMTHRFIQTSAWSSHYVERAASLFAEKAAVAQFLAKGENRALLERLAFEVEAPGYQERMATAPGAQYRHGSTETKKEQRRAKGKVFNSLLYVKPSAVEKLERSP